MVKKFLRRVWGSYSKLGRNKKKKQKWRKPKGRHNKMRERSKGRPAVVSVGYKRDKTLKNKIDNQNMTIIKNAKDIERMQKGEIAIIGKMGKKKKIEIAKRAKEKNIEVHNLNISKFLKKISSKNKKIENKTPNKEDKK